jgi:Cd2+/Zn2+-exporting ATPase
LGRFILGDTIKENAKSTVSMLKRIGIKECLMLSGDNKQVAQSVGNLVGFDRVLSELLPNEKSKVVEDIVKNGKKKLFFAGDGINDAPSLAIADVGISMGKLGSDEALQASDVSIMDDDLSKIPLSIIHSRKIRKIVYENIVFSLGLKLSIMILSVFIYLPVWVAMLSDVGVMLLAVLNSFRCSKLKRIK